MSLQSSDEKAKKEDRPSSSPLESFGDTPDEEEPSDDISKPKKRRQLGQYTTKDYDSGRQGPIP